MEKSPATVKGHMDQLRQNIQSTKNKATSTTVESSAQEKQHEATQVKINDPGKTHEVYTTVINLQEETAQSHSDLTGRFPHISSTGHQYILIMYHYDTNGILVVLKQPAGPDSTGLVMSRAGSSR